MTIDKRDISYDTICDIYRSMFYELQIPAVYSAASDLTIDNYFKRYFILRDILSPEVEKEVAELVRQTIIRYVAAFVYDGMEDCKYNLPGVWSKSRIMTDILGPAFKLHMDPDGEHYFEMPGGEFIYFRGMYTAADDFMLIPMVMHLIKYTFDTIASINKPFALYAVETDELDPDTSNAVAAKIGEELQHRLFDDPEKKDAMDTFFTELNLFREVKISRGKITMSGINTKTKIAEVNEFTETFSEFLRTNQNFRTFLTTYWAYVADCLQLGGLSSTVVQSFMYNTITDVLINVSPVGKNKPSIKDIQIEIILVHTPPEKGGGWDNVVKYYPVITLGFSLYSFLTLFYKDRPQIAPGLFVKQNVSKLSTSFSAAMLSYISDLQKQAAEEE